MVTQADNSGGTGQGHDRSPRSCLKCDECRKASKKCEPVDRIWDNRLKKCNRCERTGKECGPNKRKARAPREHTPADVIARPMVSHIVQFA